MQRRTPSPNTQSGVSVKSRTTIYVLTKYVPPFLRVCFIAGRRAKKKKQSRHRIRTPPRSGLGIVTVRLVFLPSTLHAAIPPCAPRITG